MHYPLFLVCKSFYEDSFTLEQAGVHKIHAAWWFDVYHYNNIKRFNVLNRNQYWKINETSIDLGWVECWRIFIIDKHFSVTPESFNGFQFQFNLIEDDPATVYYNSIALAYVLTLFVTKIIELGIQNRDYVTSSNGTQVHLPCSFSGSSMSSKSS